MCALCGGALTSFLGAFRRTVIVRHLTMCLIVGMFLTSVIFYTPIGHLSFWDGDEKFLFAFCCISVVIGTLFFFVPKFGDIFGSSMLGAYAIVLVPNHLLDGSLQYILLVTPLRLRTPVDFFLERPYHLVDYILEGVWALIWIIGFVVKYCRSRDRNFDLSDMNPFVRSDVVTRHESSGDVDERTPLIGNLMDNENRLGDSYFGYNN